jgi:hypothetical protein
MYSTDAEYGMFVKELNELGDMACNAYLYANAFHPSESHFKVLRDKLTDASRHLKIALARLGIMESGLKVDDERQAKQPVLFGGDLFPNEGPYGRKAGGK